MTMTRIENGLATPCGDGSLFGSFAIRIATPISIFLLSLAVLVLAPAGSAFAAVSKLAPPEMACRDCPFPMKVGEERYLMPNGALYIEVHEIFLPNRVADIRVTLRDVKSGELLATGSVRERRGRRMTSILLADNQGDLIRADIFWSDASHVHFQVKLTCEGCSIATMFD